MTRTAGVSFLTVNRRLVANVVTRALAAVSVLAVEAVAGELKAVAARGQILAVYNIKIRYFH